MAIYYYLSVFPVEALIASELQPEEFGSYMSIGSRKGSAEKMIFIRLKEEFGDHFDWEYAHRNCVPHADGRPKHSVYLSVYRVLEFVPLERMESMYLTTMGGKVLELPLESYEPIPERKSYYLYQELCPIKPLVVSSLTPSEFASYMTNPASKIFVPAIVFADLKVIDFEDQERTGNIGGLYDRNIEHLKDCIRDVTELRGKANKTLDRSHVESFSYQVIGNGIYVGTKDHMIQYRMPSLEVLNRDHYQWAKTARIL